MLLLFEEGCYRFCFCFCRYTLIANHVGKVIDTVEFYRNVRLKKFLRGLSEAGVCPAPGLKGLVAGRSPASDTRVNLYGRPFLPQWNN